MVGARPECIDRRPRRTSLKRGEASVQTVEHLLAATFGLQIDNLLVELDAEELPGADGSAEPFARLLSDAGIIEQDAEASVLTVYETLFVSQGDASLIAMPQADNNLVIIYNLDYDSECLPCQNFTFVLEESGFTHKVAPARTFLPESEAESLRRQGIGKGATYANTLVIGSDGSVIDNDLRFPNEFARHKVLDILGDLALLGTRLHAHVVGVRSGHGLNWALVRKLADSRRRKLRHASQDILLDSREIERILPHRYPLLLLDRVVEMDGTRRAVGIKNVTVNEPFFQGHFPGRPIMPGVLQIEAMAQLAGVLLLKNMENVGRIPVMLSLDKVKLRRPVIPGDQLRLEVEVRRLRSRSASVVTTATVAGKVVSEAQISFMLVDGDDDQHVVHEEDAP